MTSPRSHLAEDARSASSSKLITARTICSLVASESPSTASAFVPMRPGRKCSGIVTACCQSAYATCPLTPTGITGLRSLRAICTSSSTPVDGIDPPTPSALLPATTTNAPTRAIMSSRWRLNTSDRRAAGVLPGNGRINTLSAGCTCSHAYPGLSEHLIRPSNQCDCCS